MEDKIEQVIEDHRSSGKFLEVAGINTFALDYGSGEAVLCLHGVPTSSFLYRKLLKELAARGFRGIAIDLPGLGLSERPEDFDYSFANFTNFLIQAILALELDKFHLVVHDIGGPIGFALAVTTREKVLSLTILNTWIDLVNFQKPLPMRPFEKPILSEVELALVTRTTWPLVFNSLGVKDSSGISEEEMKAYVDLLKHNDGGKAFLKIMKNFDDTPEFRTLCYQAVQQAPYPIQAIWGEDDPGLTYDRYGMEIKEAAGLKEVHKLPARHLLQEEQWKALADKIEEIIEISRSYKPNA